MDCCVLFLHLIEELKAPKAPKTRVNKHIIGKGVTIHYILEDDELDLLIAEVKQAVKELTERKSLRCDNITSGEIESSGARGIKIYHKLTNMIWKTGELRVE